ncbi:hypothetical protein ACS2QD_00575 [Bacillus cereus group sp. Bce036]|uniref:hypothetical protein n=1 Tax=Bacillus cereus group TaxID=86661 RepID=UPI000BFE5013|nr:hypothetical protein [Bacillus thuringiensis]MDA1991970.1 hypothetical protein [Bacillus cereus]MDA1997814.1 hypothetical protein [Bacillus cereus]MDA2515558.1 hypothetical protein [Bacillus cereus]PGT60652.1 hypothetical protein COD16_13605 [Bacillus thuringiensis]
MKIFFSFLFAIAMLATFILLITSLVFRLKKKPNTKKYFKFTGIAFILSIISLIVVNMNMTPQEKQEILAKQKAEEKLKAEEKQKDKEQKEAEEKLKAEEKQKAKEQKEAEEKLKAEEKQKAKEQKEAEEQKKAEEKQKEFTSYAQNIRGGNFIKDMKLNNKDAEITFHDSFASYKSAKPDSNVTEEQYKQYFSTGDAIEKMFVSEPARLLRQFPDLNAVKMTLPFEGKTYNINLDRKSLNSHLEFKIEDLKVEDKSWVKKFNDPYVYNKAKRKAFFTKFVTVQ